jgi:hypothetical protein
MMPRPRWWAILAASYVTAMAAIQLLWRGGASLTVEAIGRAAAVLAIQAGALEIAARVAGFRRRGHRVDPIGGFLIVWISLLIALGVGTLAVDLATRKLDLTSAVVFTLLSVPALQAWALMAALSRGAEFRAGWHAYLRHPLTRPVLLLDAVILALGLLIPNHPLMGLAAVGLLQRRWAGTKLFAAALMLAAAAARPRTPQPALPAVALAAALAALGADTFAPWLFTLSSRLPAPLSLQPRSIIWLEVYGAAAALVLIPTIGLRRALGPSSHEARSLLASAAIAFFVATLALLMNGFLRLEPVFPWGFVVVTAGSIAASAYAGAALLIASRGEAAVAPDAASGD